MRGEATIVRRHPYSHMAVLFRPLCWPRWLRRLAIVTAPLSVPCWVVVVLAAILIDVLVQLARVIAPLWNGRQRHLYRTDYFYGGYGRRDLPDTRLADSVPETALPGDGER